MICSLDWDAYPARVSSGLGFELRDGYKESKVEQKQIVFYSFVEDLVNMC